MSLNQNIRFARPNVKNINNPQNLFSYIKPSRWLFGTLNPIADIGESEFFYVNTTTGDLFQKTGGQWIFKYNFNTGPITGITAIESDGLESIVKPIIGSTIHLKGIGEGSVNQINVDPSDPDSLLLSMKSNYKPDLLQFISDNTALGAGFGAGYYDPNTIIGNSQGYQTGSLFIELPQYKFWVCTDGASSTWNVYQANSGVDVIQNIGSGAQVFRDTVNGVSTLKSIQGNGSKGIGVFQTANQITVETLDNYKPLTLSLVSNKKDNRDAPPSAPLPTDDDTLGYSKGSLYYEFEPSNMVKMWACVNPQTGAADWREVGGVGSVKGYATYYNLASSGQSFSDLNYASMAIGPTLMGVKTNTNFSSLYTGGTLLFRRGPAQPSVYLCTVSISLKDVTPFFSTTEVSRYQFQMLDNVTPIDGSNMTIALNGSGMITRSGRASVSFTVLMGSVTQDLYLQVKGVLGAASIAPGVIYEEMTVTFTEV